MEFKPTRINRTQAGFTVMELLVGAAISGLVLASAATFFLFSVRSFAAMANYTDLNTKDRQASDTITRDVRNALSVVSATTNQIVLQAPPVGGNHTVTYTYDPAAATTSGAGRLTRTDSGSSRILLAGVTSFSFSIYQRPGTNSTYNTFSPATPSDAKLVAFQWACSRKLPGTTRAETESVQMGLVFLRN